MSETTTQQQQPEQTNKQAAAIAAIAALLLISEDEESLSPRITTLLAGLGIASLAVRQAVRLAMIRPVTTIPATATGARATTRQAEFFYRATYIIQAARRFHDGSRAGRPMAQMMVDERRNYERHLDAQSRRAESARRIDVTARREGTTLGWYAVMDNRTSAECRRANGKNFDIDRRPPIGFPGTVHPHCRCTAGPPHDTSQTVYSIRFGRERRAA